MPNTSQKLKKARNNRDLSVFDITSIDDLSDRDIQLIFELAEIFKTIRTEKLDLLKGKTTINAFFENSTRTRTSFELAAKHLGADTANVIGDQSSAKKGEGTLDTIRALSALQPQVIVIRATPSGTSQFIAKHVAPAIVNAGDGWHEHPTQGLLDAKTMLDHHKTLRGKVVTLVGDLLHSRVTGSLIRILPRLGAKVRVCAPETLYPVGIEQFGVKFTSNVEKALSGADVVYAIRMQQERGAAGYIPSLQEYARTYCITPKRFALTSPNAILMDAGPVIRDLSISSELVTHERCRILDEVENGLAIRKALLWLLADRNDGKKKSFTPA